MKIIKKELTKENFNVLTSGLLDGETLISKKDNFFFVDIDLINPDDGLIQGIELGRFQQLKLAVLFAQSYEKALLKYEYCCQKQTITKEGYDDMALESMGSSSWELCAVDNGMFIYKRIKIQ